MRRRYDKDGNKLYGVLRVKIFMPGNAQHENHVFHADVGKGFTADGVDEILRKISDRLEEKMPHHEFNLVELRDNTFNFVWAGKKKKDASVGEAGGIGEPQALLATNEMASGVGSNLGADSR
jgi:hypothetical protein